MKYKFKDVPDEHGDGFIAKYIEAISNVNPTNRFKLVIDYDLCAPMETWTLTLSYVKEFGGDALSIGEYKQQVYHGKSLTEEQVDMMVDLVMETDYLNFGEFISA
jgi:hypothetical protein